MSKIPTQQSILIKEMESTIDLWTLTSDPTEKEKLQKHIDILRNEKVIYSMCVVVFCREFPDSTRLR